ncbi:MAG: hypothetical protein IJ697_07890 [Synergistaceae bacterium]|nr:hypothetical protein [Synergistaceae bacterium]
MENNSAATEEQGLNGADSVETWKIYREAAQLEYEYAHIRSNRLDNKVYILLAVCAFLFPVLYSVRIEIAGVMASWPVFLLTAVTFSPLICLSCAIILLLYAIKTVQISRVDVLSTIQDADFNSEAPIDTEKKFALLYITSSKVGKIEQDRKYIISDIALVFIIISVLLFVTSVIQHDYTEIKKGGEVNMSMNYSSEISKEDASRMTADEVVEYAMKTGKLLRTPTTRELMKSKYFTFPGVPKKN